MLAIVIPFYKLTFFEATLKSLDTQTDKRFKVYIGDDASAEDCTFLLEQFRGKFDFKYHRFENNLGGISLSRQWERCIALSADEEWIMILGDDDVLGDNVVEEFYKLNKKNRDLIRYSLKVIDNYGEVLTSDFDHNFLESSDDLLQVIFDSKEIISASEFIFSRKIYDKYKGFVEFPLAWFSDYATWLLYSKENGFYNINNASVFWRLSQINISAQLKDKRVVQQKIKSLFLFLLFLNKNFNCKEEKIKVFANAKIIDFSFQLPFFDILIILVKELFTYKIKFTSLLILIILLKKIKKKILK